MCNEDSPVKYDDWLKEKPKRTKKDKCIRGHVLSETNVVFRKNKAHGYVRMCVICLDLKTNEPKTRSKLHIGYTNPNDIKIIDGPERTRNTLSWWAICPICSEKFLSTTHSFDTLKSCYGCRGAARRSGSELTTWRVMYGVVKGRKKAKELGFNLSLEDFISISSKPCFYCGVEPLPKNISKPWYPAVKASGLDRVDSSLGYLIDNVVPCCERCNAAKGTLSVNEFKVFIEKVYERFCLEK